jgi:hypothetical protein
MWFVSGFSTNTVHIGKKSLCPTQKMADENYFHSESVSVEDYFRVIDNIGVLELIECVCNFSNNVPPT